MSNYIVPGKSRRYIGKIAKEFRKKFNIENTAYFNIVDFLELNFCPKYNMYIEILPKGEMYPKEAEIFPLLNVIKIREDVYDNATENDTRSRFTIGHEIGHFILHSDIYSFQRVSSDLIIPKYKDPEWQANAFAGELLAPSYLIGDRSVEKIMNDFCVSTDCANIQYKNRNKVLGIK